MSNNDSKNDGSDNHNRSDDYDYKSGESKVRVFFLAIIAPVLVTVLGYLIIKAIEGPTPPPTPSVTNGGQAPAELPPLHPIEISFVSSRTKQAWIDAVTADFNSRQFKTATGRPIEVTVTHTNSGDPQQAILAGTLTPTMWSPGEQSWAGVADEEWRITHGKPLLAEACTPTVRAPIGFGMWRPMAEALGWPDTPISWQTIISLAADPEGWAGYGHPEWGKFKFGHTHPDYSNSGILILTALVYGILGQTGDLTFEDVKSEPVVEAMRELELHTYHYGEESQELARTMIENGPAYLHAINMTEAELLRSNQEYAETMEFPLAFIFPAEGTFWADHPLCILDGDWVTDEEQEAARIYRDFLLQPEQQARTVSGYVRPVIDSIPLSEPFTLENGTDPGVTPAVVPALPSPPNEVTEAIKDLFHQVKKKATIAVVLDTSGSMSSGKLKSAKEATINFIKRLAQEDEVTVYVFNSGIVALEPSGAAGVIKEQLSQTIGGLFAEGDTVLYDAICRAVQDVEAARAADVAAGEQRLYGVVVLSDGQDTLSRLTENDMYNCLPTGEDVEGIKVFTIAYGEDADHNVLLRVANQTNGLKFEGDEENLEEVYKAISAEQ